VRRAGRCNRCSVIGGVTSKYESRIISIQSIFQFVSLDLSMSMNVRLDVNAFMTDFYILMEMRLD
jgi:hypothetical protein